MNPSLEKGIATGPLSELDSNSFIPQGFWSPDPSSQSSFILCYKEPFALLDCSLDQRQAQRNTQARFLLKYSQPVPKYTEISLKQYFYFRYMGWTSI